MGWCSRSKSILEDVIKIAFHMEVLEGVIVWLKVYVKGKYNFVSI